MRVTAHNRGFTLLEAVIGMGLATVIMVFALGLARDTSVFSAANRDMLAAQDDARRAFKRMTAELRAAAYAENGAFPIAEATSTAVTFYADADKNGVVERIRYSLNGTSMRRGVIVPTGNPSSYVLANETTQDIVNNVANGSTPIFTFYNASYDGTNAALTLPTTLANIRMVGITLTIERNTTRLPGPQTYSTQVSLRNLKDNL